MTRTDLINEIAKSVDLTKADTTKVVVAYEQVVAKSLSRGDDVSLIGFGKFAVVERSARDGRNPHSGKKIKIPAKRVVKFRIGKRLADSVL